MGQLNPKTKLGDLRKIAKDIKKDHELAMELWSAGGLLPRLLAILVMDNKRVSQDFINELDSDMQAHPLNERNQLMDWLMANQLMKDKKTIALIESWENSPSALQRRVFWYYQARLRWTGQTPPPNTPELLTKIEAAIAKEEPEVQWAMNFAAGWIGVHEKQYRNRCVALGRKQAFIKVKWYQKGVPPIICPNSLLSKATSEIYNPANNFKSLTRSLLQRNSVSMSSPYNTILTHNYPRYTYMKPILSFLIIAISTCLIGNNTYGQFFKPRTSCPCCSPALRRTGYGYIHPTLAQKAPPE